MYRYKMNCHSFGITTTITKIDLFGHSTHKLQEFDVLKNATKPIYEITYTKTTRYKTDVMESSNYFEKKRLQNKKKQATEKR